VEIVYINNAKTFAGNDYPVASPPFIKITSTKRLFISWLVSHFFAKKKENEHN